MRWAFSMFGLVAMGLCGILVILLFQKVTVGNEQDYYLLKEATEAAMIDSIDFAYYRDTGNFKMIQEKFVENFTRRYSEVLNVNTSSNFVVNFYNIMEMPPKVSVEITNDLGTYRIWDYTENYSLANRIDAILEADDAKLPKNFDNKCKTITMRYYSAGYGEGGTNPIESPDLQPIDEDGNRLSGYKIDSINFIRRMLTANDDRTRRQVYYSLYGMYDNSGWSISSNLKPNNFAKNFTVTGPVAIGNNKTKWTADYECEETSELNTNSEGVVKGKCVYGIVYDIVWRQYENCE